MAAAQYYDEVQQAYLAYYGRPADPAGLAYWATQLSNAGGNLNSIINAFGTSAESTALYGGSNTAAQITAIYQTLFGRTPDATGLNFYVNGIATGQFTLASVALNIYYGAQNADATALAAKLVYADAFTAALEASPSAQAAYAGTAASTNARAAVATVVDTTSEQTAATNLSTTVANISTGAVGQTSTLTSGVDAIALTGNNNVVNGIIGNTATGSAQAVSTFTPLDSITAASGSTGNVLNLAVTTAAGAAASDIPAGVTVSGVQTVNLTDAGATGVDNFTSWTGLTQLNVNEVGGAQGITVAGTTNVTLTDAAAAATVTTPGGVATPTAANINVQGGANVSVTANGVNSFTTAGQAQGTINVGTTTVPTGTVTVVATELATATGANTSDAINVKGGTTVTITANLNELAGAGNTVTGGTVAVTGTSATTTVTVNQTTAAKAAAAVAATVGSPAVPAVAAGPGVTGVAAVAATATAAAKVAAAGVVDGAVQVVDANFGSTNANTITSVTLSNYGANSYIEDNALTNLSLSGASGTLTIANATSNTTVVGVVPTTLTATTPTANSTLNLTLNGVTGTAASVNGLDTIVDLNNEIKTLNVTTTTAASTLAGFADTGLTALNVSGTNVLTLGGLSGAGVGTALGTATDASLKTLNISGSAGFSDGATAFNGAGALSAYGSALTITDTSSGTFKAALDATTQSFTGSTGQDVITINGTTNATAFKSIAAGSATNNELILDGGSVAAAYGLTAAQAAKLTGFQTIGVTNTLTAATTAAINLAVLDANASTLDFIGNATTATAAAQTVAFTNAAKGAAISIDASYSSGAPAAANTLIAAGSFATVGNDVISVNYADATGASDSATVTLGAATNAKAIIVDQLNVADANGVGIGTLNLVSNDSAYVLAALGNTSTPNAGNILGTLGDSGLATLNVSGTGALTINALNEQTANTTATGVASASITPATSFTLNNTDTGVGGVTISTFTDNSLGNLSFTGTGNSTITTMYDSGATVLNISNTGSGLDSIGTLAGTVATATNLSSLTLSGNIALGQSNAAVSILGLQDSFASGVTVSGATDNAHVNVNLTAGAAATFTDSITLGNGNNYVIDASSAGKVNITVGTGSNLIDVSSTVLTGATAATVTATTTNEASTYAASVTLGAHSAATGVDSIVVGGVAANTATVAQTVINGAGAGDIISFRGDSVTAAGATTFGLTTATQATATQQAALTAAATTSLASAVTLADTYLGAGHAAIGFQFGGNTYIVEHTAATTVFAAGDAVIELTGTHTVGSVNAAHGLVLAS
jgi:S-layer protein